MAVGHGLVQAADVYPRTQSRAPGLRGAPWLPSEGIRPHRGRTQGQDRTSDKSTGKALGREPGDLALLATLPSGACYPRGHRPWNDPSGHPTPPSLAGQEPANDSQPTALSLCPRFGRSVSPRSICRMAPLPSLLMAGEAEALEGQGGSHSQAVAGLVGARLCVQTSLGGAGCGCWGQIPSNYSGLPTVRAGPAPRWWLTARAET